MTNNQQYRWIYEQQTLKRPIIYCSLSNLALELEREATYEGTFIIRNVSESYLKGQLFSSIEALYLDRETFEGNEVIVTYNINMTELRDKKKEVGYIHILSNGGEIKIPVTLQIKPSYIHSSIGLIKDLYQFTDLARIYWQEAVTIFYEASFITLIKEQAHLVSVYHLLTQSTSKEQALEAFLNYIHKKQSPKISGKVYEDISHRKGYILLEASGWGWLEGTVDTDTPYIRLQRKTFHHHMFKSNQLIIPFELLEEGVQGYIYVTTTSQQLCFSINGVSAGKAYDRKQYRKKSALVSVKIPDYITYRLTSVNGLIMRQLSNQMIESLLERDLSFNQKVLFYNYLFNYHKEAYLDKIIHFVKAGIKRRNLSVDFIHLCKALYHETKQKNDSMWLPLYFYWEIKCNNPKMKFVVVAHEELKEMIKIPLIKGRAIIPLYTHNYRMMLVDEHGYGHIKGIKYVLNKIINYWPVKTWWHQGSKNKYLMIYLSHKGLKYRQTEEYIEIYRKTLLSQEISNAFRCELQLLCIHHYYEYHQFDAIKDCLEKIDLELVSEKDRGFLMELMILTGLYDEVLEGINRYGYDLLGIKKIYRLCHHLLDKTEKIKQLDELCFYIFERRKYDEKILYYLMEKFDHALVDMLDLWLEGKRLGLISEKLEERILNRVLYSETYLEESLPVFKSYYIKHQGSLLVEAFIHYLFFQYVVHDYPLPDYLFQILQDKAIKQPLKGTLEYALFKYLSKKKDKTSQEIYWVKEQLNHCIREGKILPWFEAFDDCIKIHESIKDKGYLLHITEPNYKVICHYRMESDKEFHQKEMGYIGCGMFFCDFYLFYDEKIEYYIEERRNKISYYTKSDIYYHRRVNWENHPRSANHLINTMRMSILLHDDRSLEEAIETYLTINMAMKDPFTML